MLRSYFKIAWRNLLRNKVFSLINITGLAIGLAVGFVIYQYVEAERGYDKFHQNADRLYRIPISYTGSFSSIRPSATNHPAVGPAMKADFPEVQEFTRLVRASLFIPAATMSYDNGSGAPATFNEERVFLADESFFSMFTFPFVEGTTSALKEPNSIVITKSIAKKYFGSEPALDKMLKLNLYDFKVTGVIEDVPENSHLQFDFIISMATVGQNFYDAWTWPEFYNYVLLKPGTDPAALESKFPAFMEKYLGKIWEEYKFKSSIFLQPVTDIHLRSDLGFEQSINGDETTVYFLSVLAILILVIAWINYVNLSSAKALERSKEVGLRKVSGATRVQLITQFFFDALLVNVLAVILAAGLLFVTMPYFENVTGKDIFGILSSTGAWYSLSFWGVVVAILLTGILVVGIYPALLLSSFNPALVLKGKFLKSAKGIVLRQGLVIFQYALSIILIAGTITISRQLTFMQQQDVGYDKEQILVVRAAAIFDSTYTSQIRFFRNELLNMSTIDKVAASSEMPGHAIADRNSIRKLNDAEQDKVGVFHFQVDHEFASTFGMELVAGRNFNENDKFLYQAQNNSPVNQDGFWTAGGQNKIIVNEDLAEKLGFRKPEDAISQIVKLRVGQEYAAEIIGVMKNHHQLSLKQNFDPIVYYYPEFDYWRYFSIRMNSSALPETIDQIKKIYTAAFPNNAFEYFFLDDDFNKQYEADVRFGIIFGTFTALAIIISCLGLFGLGVFAVSQRIREIGIRKVLGASAARILILFSNDSIRLVLISYVIAVPLIYLGIKNWLSNFAFHINLDWTIFCIPPLILLLISVVSIVFICLRSALMNPATSLRHE